jgi:tRNA (adenine57-N1/adenine58-N1)-methyltransferase catalytic subunit
MRHNHDITMPLPPHFRRLKRGPQVITPKDVGMIIAYTGIGKESVCVDAGTGSGWLAISLARICKNVTSYDIREEFTKIGEKNKELEHLDNLDFRSADIFKKIYEKNVDLVTLDLPGSEKALKNAKKALKEGGYVVGYLPHMEQVSKFVKALEKLKFTNILTLEAIVRDILVREQGIRPSTKGVWHTAYLVFAQKK